MGTKGLQGAVNMLRLVGENGGVAAGRSVDISMAGAAEGANLGKGYRCGNARMTGGGCWRESVTDAAVSQYAGQVAGIVPGRGAVAAGDIAARHLRAVTVGICALAGRTSGKG